MNLIGNIIWLIFGGLIVFIEYMIAGFVLCVTIIGLPFAKQHFKLMRLSFTPFGKEIV